MMLSEQRLLPSDPAVRGIAESLYAGIAALPIVSPHGHCNPRWFADDVQFTDPTELLVKPDHYLLRLFYSQGIELARLGRGVNANEDNRAIWQLFAEHYPSFEGTPSKIWLDHAMQKVLLIEEPLTAENADRIYNDICRRLRENDYSARKLFERFGIEVLATTEGAFDGLQYHDRIAQSDWKGRVITTYRPDQVTDPDTPDFSEKLARFGAMTGEDTANWKGYLNAHRKRREEFRRRGATATDHSHPNANTADLGKPACQHLLDRILVGTATTEDKEAFRAQVLTEMAGMSREDGMVMQLHCGVRRNHNSALFSEFGPDIGGDMPRRAEFVNALAPLLNRHGNDPNLRLVLFTLDESNYSRELAPLAGHWPCLRIGPPWWFHDSPEGMRRYFASVIETAGFANLAGFNDDTRAFFSIPARHDMWRRELASFLARLVTEGRLSEAAAHGIAADLAYHAAKRVYGLTTP